MYSSDFQPSFNISSELQAKPMTIPLISGEYVKFTGKCSEGLLMLTNYRLILQYMSGVFNIPLGVIDQTEIKKVLCLQICCKDARSYKSTFDSSELCLEWQKKILDSTAQPSSVEEIFASSFCQAVQSENADLHLYLSSENGENVSYMRRSSKIFYDEVKRLGYDLRGSWKISTANENFELCPTYPRRLVIPSSMSDKFLKKSSEFRASRRIPTVVWRHSNGAVIARSSQPEVGWLWWRSAEDESIVKALAEACAYNSQSTSITNGQSENIEIESHGLIDGQVAGQKDESTGVDSSSLCNLPDAKSQRDIKKLLIMDARSYATAVANRARGGGVECMEYYPMCEIQFMNLDNIHTIRKSHHALRNIVTLPSDIPNWLTLLESTRWFYHMSGLLRSAVTVAQTIAIEGRPVLVHCSDGWDRTPQITALAELLLDPYYRTFEGLRVLIEREWIEFGHKFSDRCGCGVEVSEDLNERCPIFLQWIDCVYQIQSQFPTAFQFNQGYLVKLVQHVYSNLFDTFLFNSSKARVANEENNRSSMFSIWPYFSLHQYKYINHLYAHSERVLYPSFHTKDLVLWKAVYMDKVDNPPENAPSSFEANFTKGKVNDVPSPPGELTKTKSCDSLLDLSPTSSVIMIRRSSDPNLCENSVESELLDATESGGSKIEVTKYQKRRVSVDEKTIQSHKDNRVPMTRKKKLHCSAQCLGVTHGFNGTGNVDLKVTAGSSESHGKKSPSSVLADCVEDSVRTNGSTDTLVAENGIITESSGLDKNVSSNAMKVKLPPVSNLHATGGVKLSSNRGKLKECLSASNSAAISSLMSSPVCGICKKVLSCDENEVRNHFVGAPAGPANGDLKSSVAVPFSRSSTNQHSDKQSQMSLCSHFNDGLSLYTDEVTQRLNQIKLTHQLEVDNLKRELRATKSFYIHLLTTKLNQNPDANIEDQDSLPESVGSGSGESGGPESSGMSDASWEALEENDAKSTLWVPDHAVDSCMNCHSRFWIGRRRHHCRSCGKIFCSACSQNSLPVPHENLYDPVRVCSLCFTSFLELGSKNNIQVAAT